MSKIGFPIRDLKNCFVLRETHLLYVYFYGNKFNNLIVPIYQSQTYKNTAFLPYHKNHLSSQNILRISGFVCIHHYKNGIFYLDRFSVTKKCRKRTYFYGKDFYDITKIKFAALCSETTLKNGFFGFFSLLFIFGHFKNVQNRFSDFRFENLFCFIF